MTYHKPVLADASVEALNIQPNGIYVDATFGGGGHSRIILEHLGPKGKLLGFDQDADARVNALADERFLFVPSNFRYLKRFLRLYEIEKVDGILADLGVSSHQLDVPERGFSYRFEAELDMRMNQEQVQTAADILNNYSAADLQQVLGTYGEVRNAKTLAQHIVEERSVRPIKTINDLLAILDPMVRGQRLRYLSQVFQALRIEVNDEMGALEDFLKQSIEVLGNKGRLSVITYHSLEDRLVKNYLKAGSADGKYEQDFYGNIYRPFKVLTKKATLPTEAEIKENSRARSAKLRVGARVIK
ncbi:MAG: 16S rRNA (cytosine(1402)-N(4))-methyltransferase RsmH [Saprospiraceae bacterium]